MTPDNKERLQHLRSQNQMTLEAEYFITEYIRPVYEVMDYFRNNGRSVQINGFRGLPQRLWPIISAGLLKDGIFNSFAGWEQTCNETDVLIDGLMRAYPSRHALRYVPDLSLVPVSADEHPIMEGMITAGVSTGSVHLYYMKFSPLFTISLEELTDCAHEEIFNTWHGDTVVFPKNLDWLISYSLEDDWYAGRLLNP